MDLTVSSLKVAAERTIEKLRKADQKKYEDAVDAYNQRLLEYIHSTRTNWLEFARLILDKMDRPYSQAEPILLSDVAKGLLSDDYHKRIKVFAYEEPVRVDDSRIEKLEQLVGFLKTAAGEKITITDIARAKVLRSFELIDWMA